MAATIHRSASKRTTSRSATPNLDERHLPGEAQSGPALVDLDPGHSSTDTQSWPARVDLAGDHARTDDQCFGVPGDLAPGQKHDDAHAQVAGGDTLPPTNVAPNPKRVAPAAFLSDPGRTSSDAQKSNAGADLDGAHENPESQSPGGAVNSSPQTKLASSPKPRTSAAQPSPGTITRPVPSRTASPGTSEAPSPEYNASPGSLPEFALGMAAANLADIEKLRMAMGNRLGAMEREGIAHTPEYAADKVLFDGIAGLEHQATLNLRRTLRKHPLGPWVKATVGIGEKQGARLIAAIRDPYWNHLYDRPRRGAAELWAYCGYAPEQKRRKGVKSNWNADAKMRAHLVAESCIKQMHSPYRARYDAARAAWADRDTSDGHKHNHALRLVAKAVLKDLFLAAKETAA